jgi:6-phosphogluconolactonase (cycloisomerase 2 family)
LQCCSSALFYYSAQGADVTEVREDEGLAKRFVYVGTDKNPVAGRANGEGLCLFEMDDQTGALTFVKVAAKIRHSSWLCLHPTSAVLYTVHEAEDIEHGLVSAYAMDRTTGDLTSLNTVSSHGIEPCHLSIDAQGKHLFVANYEDGSIAVLPVLSGGSLGEAVFTHRDAGEAGGMRSTTAPPGSFAISGHDGPHTHMIVADPSNRFVLHTDLGQDRIYTHRLESATGQLEDATHISLPDGDGPRHLCFHANGTWVYSIQEEASTIAFFHFDPSRGTLSLQQTLSALPDRYKGTSFGSAILVNASGSTLYAANRLHNSIAVFSIGSSGMLSRIAETPTLGDYPNHFNLDPTGCFLYVGNHRSDQITSFRVDRETGKLTFTGDYTAIGSPACIVFVP